MSDETLATPRAPNTDSKINDLKCQTALSAHTEPKGQFGEVSNLPDVLDYFGRAIYPPDNQSEEYRFRLAFADAAFQTAEWIRAGCK